MKKNNFKKENSRYSYILLFFLCFILLDYILRKTYLPFGDVKLYDRIPLLFVIGWSCIFCGIAMMLPCVLKNIFMSLSVGCFAILTLVHGAYINVFDKFFSFSDLSLLKEGVDFVDGSYIDIRKRIIFVVIIVICLLCVAIWLTNSREFKNEKRYGIVAFLIGIIFISGAKGSFPPIEDAAAWNAASNITIVYEDFVDTKRSMLLSGVYEYTARDIWKGLDLFSDIKYEEQIEQLDEYFARNFEEKKQNGKTGIFKDKNLILIQLENIDKWMLTETNMPNLYKLQKEGIDFENHYSISFATGKTFNTEFIVNTGLVPQSKGEAPSYIYSKNYYPNSLAKTFKKNGYSANSYHASYGHVYNRGKVHEVFGYEDYHDCDDMKMSDYTRDSQMLNNFEIMAKEDKFFDFMITYSGHGPFSVENTSCSAHIEEVRAENEDSDEVYLCGLAQAKETDQFVGILLEKLKEYSLLENTVLVFYTDHYAYSTISKEKELFLKGTNDPNLIQNTPFFIWCSDLKPEKIQKVTSTVDILPTLANLFDLDTEYKYWVGRDAFDDYKGHAFFSDFSWYDGEIYFTNKYDGEMTDYIKTMSKEVDERIKMSWQVLETDYFKHVEK